MRYGVYFSNEGDYANARLLAEMAREAEECGWEGVFIWDHIGQSSAAADPWVALTAIAMNTQRIKLGTIVTALARRRPWKLARETVTLDHLSGGRLILGVGLGWGSPEFEPFGEDASPRVRAEKLDEGLDILTGLWSGKLFSYQGKHYQVREVCFLPPPLQQPRIPIWACGAWSKRKAPFRRAARLDGVIAINGSDEDRAILPNEIRDIQSYMKTERANNEPFDIVVILWSDGRDEEAAAQYRDAGVTWWLEDLSQERFSSIDEARQRLRKGPPGRG